MARVDVATLAVKITASADAFERVLAGAESRLTAFAAKAASPVGYGSRIAGLAAGAISGPVGIAMTAASTVGKLFDPAGAHLLNPEKFAEAMDRSLERTVELAREAKRLDFEPQFLRAIRGVAGPDAAAAEKS